MKNWLIGKDPDAGRDLRQEKKGTTEDEIVGWHIDSMDMSLSKLWDIVKDREAWCAVVRGAAKSCMTEQLNNNSSEIPLYFWVEGIHIPTWKQRKGEHKLFYETVSLYASTNKWLQYVADYSHASLWQYRREETG